MRKLSDSHASAVDQSASAEAAVIPEAHAHSRPVLTLTLTALGVVYGDIGTSPLYAMKECFFGSHAVPPTHDNVLGVLSLIIYSLLLVISVKYVAIVMRADNQGEGGVLALTALVPGRTGASGPARLAVGRPILIALGIFGTALLYGDGMITPAISVLGAIEGVEVATPLFRPYVVPATVIILVALFVIQKYGTHRVGRLFGPIMIVWFVVIAAFGVTWLVRAPEVLGAVDPRHAFNVKVQYGFMEDPDVPAALLQARRQGLALDVDDLTYFLGRETIIVSREKGMAIWRENLFVLMARNAVRATAFFRLPTERVVELGVQVEM